MSDAIGDWLEGLGLGQYAEAFAENFVDEEVLPHLTGDDLKEMGVVAIGHRRKLLTAIAALGVGDEPAASLPVVAAPEPGLALDQAPEGERRQVTVLFADICGYTNLSASMDAEETHELLGKFVDRVDGIIRDFGGTVDKHVGDSAMALFGAPIAHGNDAERAVRAANAIQRAMPGLSAEIGRQIEVHIGVASGQVVASGVGGDTHYTVIGDSVNLASRLTDAAKRGEIFISAAVERAVSRLVTAEDRGEISVKGIAEPVRVYSVLDIRDHNAELDARPFVGRQMELRQFGSALEACVEAGTGQVIHLRGEAGIGKSRLIEEFRRLAVARGFAAHKAQVLDFGAGKGQDAVRILVRSLLRISPGDSEEAQAAVIEQALAGGLIGQEHAIHLSDLLDLPKSPEQKRLYDAMDNATRNRGKRETVVSMVRSLGARQPLMLIVEDLHWADEMVLYYLAELARKAEDRHLLIALTSRVEGDPIGPAWRGSISGTPLMTMDLGPLGKQDAMALAGQYLDATGQFAMSCIERAAGNPLFLDQLLRSAEEAGDSQVPGTVQSVIQARLDNLAPAHKVAAQAASVLGKRFARAALQHLIDSPNYTGNELVEHHLVAWQGDDLVFTHALVQEGIYESLLKGRRRDLHRRAANWFAATDLALRAGHLERAGDSRAPLAYLDAAQSQIAAYRFERARQLTEQGLDLASDPADIYRLTCALGEISRELGAADRSLDYYNRALANAADDTQKSRAQLGLAEAMRIVDRVDEALALLDQAQPVAERAGLTDVLVPLHHLRGNLLFPKGDIKGCESEHRRSFDYARAANSDEGEARGLGGLGDAAYAAGRMKTAHDELVRCVDICRQSGMGRVEVANSAQISHTKLYLLQLREAIENGKASIEAARRVGHVRAELNATMACQFAAVELCDWNYAVTTFERCIELSELLGALRFRTAALSFHARALLGLGRPDEALATAREGVEAARETGASFEGARVLGILARISRDLAEQDAALAEAEEIIAGGCVGHNQLHFYRCALEVGLIRKDWDMVERYAQTFSGFTAAEPLPWSTYFVARARALAAWGQGRRDDDLRAELEGLRAETLRVGLIGGLSAIERALQAA